MIQIISTKMLFKIGSKKPKLIFTLHQKLFRVIKCVRMINSLCFFQEAIWLFRCRYHQCLPRCQVGCYYQFTRQLTLQSNKFFEMLKFYTNYISLNKFLQHDVYAPENSGTSAQRDPEFGPGRARPSRHQAGLNFK